MANKKTEKTQEAQVNVNAISFGGGDYTDIWNGFNDGNNTIATSLEKFGKWLLKGNKEKADIIRGREKGEDSRPFIAARLAKGKENTIEFRSTRATSKEEAKNLLPKTKPIYIKLSAQTLNDLETLCKITKKFGELNTEQFRNLYTPNQKKTTEQENDTIELEDYEEGDEKGEES
ncbi:hypothetical protein NHP21005_20160 (plasmid) [Helicobacter sp. NHP21005]|uniref:hypothetical protein n=1 Tax=Helicobacter felistomachi TaxID=3040201 RepID=UPI0025734334|nr:hypothetical protein [Helicobacter sp. NHP21005]BEG58328.1 hypothetical protein NHP21005_20160 [Helicobacter sp. NHP21005]